MTNTSVKNTLRSKHCTLKQVCNLIPKHLLASALKDCGLKDTSRTFSIWSHTVAMMFGQLVHAVSLNDICDSLRLHASLLLCVGKATAPARNTLSHANRTRDAIFVETLFWKVLNHLESLSPGFGTDRGRKGFPRRFKTAMIHAIDSSTIQLVANCMDWAAHRRRKAACKIHVRISVHDMLPRLVIVREAKPHDNTQARELCAPLRAYEIALFDKAYLDFKHLFSLACRKVFWVIRAKSNLKVRVRKKLQKPLSQKQAEKFDHPVVLRDDIVILQNPKSRKDYPGEFRRVLARVKVDGKWKIMSFLTNNLEWSASSVGELYAARWSIEVFFKQLKGVLKLAGFLGHSLNAVRWQIWTALLVYVLLRYQAHASGWRGSFSRLFTLLRGVMWDRLDVLKLLKSYGTAGGPFEHSPGPRTTWLPGFKPKTCGTA
jgi:IS4 transposase